MRRRDLLRVTELLPEPVDGERIAVDIDDVTAETTCDGASPTTTG